MGRRKDLGEDGRDLGVLGRTFESQGDGYERHHVWAGSRAEKRLEGSPVPGQGQQLRFGSPFPRQALPLRCHLQTPSLSCCPRTGLSPCPTLPQSCPGQTPASGGPRAVWGAEVPGRCWPHSPVGKSQLCSGRESCPQPMLGTGKPPGREGGRAGAGYCSAAWLGWTSPSPRAATARVSV